MNRIDQRFAELKSQGRKALIPYITAGDPAPSLTVELMHALVAAGADMIELGVPFSDPMADGPVIQLACERALAHGTRLLDVLDMVQAFRERDTATPVVLMGYLNPIEAMGYEAFIAKAKQVGVDGVLIVDLPPEESGEFSERLRQEQIAQIFLVAPTTTPERAAKICAQGSGYLYYVSVKGVTGSAALDVQAVEDKLAQLRQLTDLPLAVGFGIKDGPSAAAVATVADGAIVGSVLVNQIAEHVTELDKIPTALGAIIADMRKCIDEAVAP